MNLLRFTFHLASFCCAMLFCVSFSSAQEANLPAAVAKIKPSIVAVGTYQSTRNPSFQFGGTGFVVGDGTYVASNSHVVPSALNIEAKEQLSIAVPGSVGNASLREATVVARDADHDLVLLKISGAPLPKAILGDSDKVREGQLYGLIGFPLGNILGLFPATHRATIAAIAPIVLPQPGSRQLDAKMIRQMREKVFNIFQLDTTAYPGNSGSPLIDPVTGEVSAIFNMGLGQKNKETNTTSPSGIGYAIPVNHLRLMLENVSGQSR